MRPLIFTLTFCSVLSSSSNPLFATTIIPYPNLGEAAKYSECVVLAQAIDTAGTDLNGTYYHDTKFKVIASIKGALWPDAEITVRPISCQIGIYDIDIAGDFKPEMGKIYLLFLYKKDDCWKPVMLSYYIFEQFQSGDAEYLVPGESEGMDAFTRPDGQAVEPLGVFHKNALLENLRAFTHAPNMVWDGSIGRTSLRREDFEAADRAVPVGCDFSLGGNLTRWQDPAIPMYYDDTNVPASWSSDFANILSALSSNYTGIDPSNAGSAAYTPNCTNGSAYQGNFRSFVDNNLNGAQSTLIIFDDPCNEIPNLNNCSGTLAFGGSYSSSQTHVFDGLNWQNANYGFLVVNNGAPACLSSTSFERLMTHELTHVYRMGHLNATTYPNQNMNPTCCNAINDKDRECMNYAYPASLPVELVRFEVKLQGDQGVLLSWVTESEKDNDHFSILHGTNGVDFTEIKQIPSKGNSNGGTYEWVDTRPFPGLNYYLLSQTDFDGTVQHLNIKAISVNSKGQWMDISANPVKNDLLQYRLDLEAPFDGTLEILAPSGSVLLSAPISLDKGLQFQEQALGAWPSGVYMLRIYNQQLQWTARFIKQ